MTPSAMPAAGFDRDQVFMVASIDGGEMTFQAISRTGVVADSGRFKVAG